MYRGVPEAISRNSLGLLVQHIKCVGVGQFICFSSITKISLKKIELTLPIRTKCRTILGHISCHESVYML